MQSPDVLLMYPPSDGHLRTLRSVAPKASLAVATDEDSARSLIPGASVVLGNRYFLQSLDAATSLQWMQSNSTGVDLVVNGASSRRDFVITSARGVYDDEVADHGLALSLALLRGIPAARDGQRDRQWRRQPLRTVRGLRVLVLGWGGVGRGIARRLLDLGAHVEAARRHRVDERDSIVVWSSVDAWSSALERTDLLVLALPLTPLTAGIVGADELSRLPRGALVVNVGRGGTLDENALFDALVSGHLGGAALDVFETEPLPDESPLWTAPGLLVSPHIARSPETPPYRWEGLFVENLRRFVGGEPLLNVVDREAGY